MVVMIVMMLMTVVMSDGDDDDNGAGARGTSSVTLAMTVKESMVMVRERGEVFMAVACVPSPPSHLPHIRSWQHLRIPSL